MKAVGFMRRSNRGRLGEYAAARSWAGDVMSAKVAVVVDAGGALGHAAAALAGSGLRVAGRPHSGKASGCSAARPWRRGGWTS
jgi:hypothetical protein